MTGMENSTDQNPLQTTRNNLFVGRKSEMQKLSAWLEAAKKGLGSFVIISGEAGTGKSTLVRQFTSLASKQGLKFITESFNNSYSYRPYAPFLRIVSKLGGSRVQKIMEMVNDHPSPVPSANESDSVALEMESLYSLQTEKGLAQQLIVSALLETTRDKPLLISLSDVHLASLTAWQFIHYLSQSLVDNKIMILVTLRQDGRIQQKEKLPIYADVLQRMNREGLVKRIELKRLGLKEVREYCRNVFPKSDFSSKFIPLLNEVSGGIPFQLYEILEILTSKKFVYEQDGIWFNLPEINKKMLLEIIRRNTSPDAFASSLKNISILHKMILHYSALMDGAIDHRLLAAILNIPAIKVIKELQNLNEKKILIAQSDGTYHFRQPALQTFLLEQIPEESKASLHYEIAEAISRQEQMDEKNKVYALAYHYKHTVYKRLAFKYLFEAGNLSLNNFAFLETSKFYREAVELVPKIPEFMNAPETINIMVKTAWLERILGNYEESLRYCKMVREQCTIPSLANFRVQILIQEGYTNYRLNRWEKAIGCFEESLRQENQLNPFDKALINYGIGNVYFEISEYPTARKYYEEAYSISQDIESIILLANILNNYGAIENVQGNHLRAIALYSQSIPLFKKIAHDSGLAQIYHNIGMTHADDGNWQKANEFYGKSLAISDVLGLMPLKSITFLNRAHALAHLAEFDQAREYNFKALRLLQQMQDELGVAEYHKIQGSIEMGEGNLEESEKHLNTALEKFSNLNNKLGLAETECELAQLAKFMKIEEKLAYWFAKAIQHYEELGLSKKIEVLREMFDNNQSEKFRPQAEFNSEGI